MAFYFRNYYLPKIHFKSHVNKLNYSDIESVFIVNFKLKKSNSGLI